MNDAAARLSDRLAIWTRGRGLAVCARRRFAVVVDLDVVYTDVHGVPELRRRFPQWASEPVAPVSIEQDPARLEKVADRSVDFVVAFEFFEMSENVPEALAGMARAIVPGGSLIMMLNIDEGQPGGREQALARVLSCEPHYRCDFRFEVAAGIGHHETAVVLERRWPDLSEGELISYGHGVYLVEAGCIRHVQSPAVLAIIQRPGEIITPIAAGQFRRLPTGKGLSESAALALVERRLEEERMQ